MIARLGLVVWWACATLGTLSTIACAMAFFMPKGDPTAGLMFGFFAIVLLAGGRAVKFILAGR